MTRTKTTTAPAEPETEPIVPEGADIALAKETVAYVRGFNDGYTDAISRLVAGAILTMTAYFVIRSIYEA